jgi:predicted nucleotidyltransferase
MKPQKRSPLKVGDFMIDIEKIKIIKKDLVKALDPSLIYIFGSISKDKVRKDSDIDIAILTDRQIDEYKLFILSQKLADVLKREVDLVDLNKASTVLKVQIIKTGKLIYNSDNLRKMYFQMRAMRDYALLNEERMEIINKIKSRSLRGA